MNGPWKKLPLSEIIKIDREATRIRDKEWREWLDRMITMIPGWDAIKSFDTNPPPDRNVSVSTAESPDCRREPEDR